MAKVIRLTHERLLKVLDYDPATGIFVWKVQSSNRVKVGDRAGALVSNGHRYLLVDREKLQASRLAWFYVHREWPKGDIKQRDGNHDNCAIENLRDVSRIDGARERGLVTNNTTGFKGVSPSRFGRFQASITWNYKQISLGANFETAAEASTVYQVAERRMLATTTEGERDAVVQALRLERRQRAAWANLVSQGVPLGWMSFDEFCADVKVLPERRYAIVAVDAALPVGPSNFRMASDGSHNTGTPEGKLAYAKANRATNKDTHRDRDFRKKYGIDLGEYQDRLLAQRGVCAICDKPETRVQNDSVRMLSVDHDHTTGDVRGLLCSSCNLALGYACDDVSILRNAISYLERHKAKPLTDPPPYCDWLEAATGLRMMN